MAGGHEVRSGRFLLYLSVMAIKPITPFSSSNPGDANRFKRKLINFCIAVLMILSLIAQFQHWDDLAEGSNAVKWILDLIALLL